VTSRKRRTNGGFDEQGMGLPHNTDIRIENEENFHLRLISSLLRVYSTVWYLMLLQLWR